MFLLLLLSSCMVVFKIEKQLILPIIIAVFSVFIIHFLFVLDFSAGNVDYFVSDELAYISGGGRLTLQASLDRSLWIVLNKVVEWPLYLDGLFNKLLGLIFLPFFMLVIYRIANNSHLSKYFVFLFPYILFLCQINLRDILIYTISFYTLFLFYTVESRIKFLILVLFLSSLAFLRPFYIPMIVLSLTLTSFLFMKSTHKKDRFIFILKIFIGVSFFSVVLYFLLSSRIDQYIRYLTYIIENGVSSTGDEKVQLGVSYISLSLVKFFTTPIPTSIIVRSLSDYYNQFGYLDDLLRFMSQLSLYLMLIWLIFLLIVKKNKWSKLMDLHNKPAVSVIIFLLLNSLLYAMYYGGGGHSRLKVGVYLILFLLILILKKRRVGYK